MEDQWPESGEEVNCWISQVFWEQNARITVLHRNVPQRASTVEEIFNNQVGKIHSVNTNKIIATRMLAQWVFIYIYTNGHWNGDWGYACRSTDKTFQHQDFTWLLLLLNIQPAKSRGQWWVPMTAPFLGRFSKLSMGSWLLWTPFIMEETVIETCSEPEFTYQLWVDLSLQNTYGE